MADQQRWFKLWCTAPTDDALQALPGRLRWAWAALGCHTKIHGTRGRVTIHPANAALAAQMDVPIGDLKMVIALLPHVSIEEQKTDNGTFTVTWHNWQRYQEDSTVYERVARLRSKKRREEKRREPPLPPQNFLNGQAESEPAPIPSPAPLPAGMVWGPYGPTPTPPPPPVHAVDHGQPGMTLPEWLALEAARQAGLAPPRAPRVPPRATGQWLPNPPEETRP